MKTKRLIELLQKADPEGEAECCVGNQDIFTVYPEPAYWDGRLQVLKRDESNPYYNVIGAQITGAGTKISIRTLSIEDAIFENPELPVEIVHTQPERYQAAITAWREESRRIINDVDKWARENGLPTRGNGPIDATTVVGREARDKEEKTP